MSDTVRMLSDQKVLQQETYRASFAQERMWFLQENAPLSPYYNVSVVLRLQGNLDLAALQSALIALENENDTLRTTFRLLDGELYAQVEAPRQFSLLAENLTEVPESERESRLLDLAKKYVKYPFDLEKEVPWRSQLLKLNDEVNVLQLVFHHICIDEWSEGILLQEIGERYKSYADGSTPPLGEPKTRYADYADLQRKNIEKGLLDNQFAYWRKELGKGCPPLELPTDFSRPKNPSYKGSSEKLFLDVDMVKQLKQLAVRHNATLFMTLLAGFQILLHRYSGQDKIVVFTPIANRPDGFYNLTGLCLNTLTLRADLTENPTVSDFLRQNRNTALDAYENQDAPFDKIVHELRSSTVHPQDLQVRALFTLNQKTGLSWELAELSTKRMSIGLNLAKTDIQLSGSETHEGIHLYLNYSTDLFSDTTIRRMLGHLKSLLGGMIEQPDSRVSDLPLLTENERVLILESWNKTTTIYPRDKCIHELFEEQVKLRPDTIAIAFGDSKLTYGELNERSNQLAHFLIKKGIGPESAVGICIDRSLETVIGLLATVKAGGTYVPLAPDYPNERFRLIKDDARIHVVIASSSSSLDLSTVETVYLNESRMILDKEPKYNPGVAIDAENLAYIMYTSGSTGTPKGVCVEHRAIVRLVRNTNYINITPEDVVAHVANVSFDAATFELWGALVNGASLAIADKDTSISPSELAKFLEAYGVTVLFLTTALFNHIAQENPRAFRGIRSLLFGGEIANPVAVKKALGHPEKLLHVYGPTECTTFATWHEVKEVRDENHSIPIGRPIANTTAYILDKYLQSVSVGIIGDLYLGGDGLARGYLNAPSLTAEKFVPDPFIHKPGSRLYKTGDLARYLPDGTIEFHGRLDHQIKIRGFRIELDEIEAVLCQHESVNECLVISLEGTLGDKRLAAYVVPNQGTNVNRQQLKQALSEKLPEYMVPSTIVFLDALPLTKNGKVDRNYLSNLKDETVDSSPENEAANSPLQESLCKIWADVLAVKKVGIYDDFFDLGGHSLLAIRLSKEVEKELGLSVPVPDVFQRPTVALFSEMLESSDYRLPDVYSYNHRHETKHIPLFCINFHNLAARLAKHLPSDQPIHGIQMPLQGELALWYKTKECHLSLEDLAARCIEIMQDKQPSGPYRIAGFCAAGNLAYEIAIQLTIKGADVQYLALIDSTYGAGISKRTFPVLHRCWYHLKNLLTEGPEYFHTKLKNKYPDELIEATSAINAEEHFLSAMIKSYRPGGYTGHLSLFRNSRDVSFSKDKGNANGWDKLLKGGVNVREYDCKHSQITLEPFLGLISKDIELDLKTEAQPSSCCSQISI